MSTVSVLISTHMLLPVGSSFWFWGRGWIHFVECGSWVGCVGFWLHLLQLLWRIRIWYSALECSGLGFQSVWNCLKAGVCGGSLMGVRHGCCSVGSFCFPSLHGLLVYLHQFHPCLGITFMVISSWFYAAPFSNANLKYYPYTLQLRAKNPLRFQFSLATYNESMYFFT